MNNIIVQDNFLSDEEMQNCLKIIESNTWKWGHHSSDKLSDTTFWQMDLFENEYFFKVITPIIEKQFSKKFKIIRLYANAHTYGQDGSYHTDSEEPNNYTFCLYFSNIAQDNVETAGGHLFFKLPELNYKICFEPKFNRGIFFPSNYIHKAVSFTRYIMDLRICVAWKLEEIFE